MSLFREHLLGGIISYTVFYAIALILFLVSIFWLDWDADKVPVISLEVWKAALCFLTATLAGLWPDVDIKSKSQQLFYRIFLILNIVLIYRGFSQPKFFFISALLGVLAMLPLIGKHRGWTHSWITMLLLPSPFLLAPMYNLSLNTYKSLNLAHLDYSRLDGLPFYLASVIGYATHLYLDGILFGRWRKKKPSKNSAKN